MEQKYSILHMPEEERPRERLVRRGSEALSSAELIAIILGNGTKEVPVMQLAQAVLARFGTLRQLAEATIDELLQIKGIGMAKAIQLKASFSLGARASHQVAAPRYKIDNPIHAYHLIKEELIKEKRELFLVILLDVKSVLITHQIVSIGSLSNTLVHPREVFYPAIRHKASSMILAHNHPSGDPTPSKEDYEITKTLIETGKIVGISVVDHLIVSQEGYISLRQQGFNFQ